MSERGFCVLSHHFPMPLIDACRVAFWPVLLEYLNGQEPNRGPRRYFVPMPFHRPCFTPEFFFDAGVLDIVRGQWGRQLLPTNGDVTHHLKAPITKTLM